MASHGSSAPTWKEDCGETSCYLLALKAGPATRAGPASAASVVVSRRGSACMCRCAIYLRDGLQDDVVWLGAPHQARSRL